MKIDLLLGRTIELGLSGIVRHVADSLSYRAVASRIRAEIGSALMITPLPAGFEGCHRAVLSFCLGDESRLEEILVRRAGNNWVFLMDLDMNREVYRQIGSRAVPLVVKTLLQAALQLAKESKRVNQADLIRLAKGANRSTDIFLASVRKVRPARNRRVELDVEFACYPGLGTSADVALRHRIEEVLDEGLTRAGCGEVLGGSMGGGRMEVHIEAAGEQKAKALILRTLEAHGLPMPTRLERSV